VLRVTADPENTALQVLFGEPVYSRDSRSGGSGRGVVRELLTESSACQIDLLIIVLLAE
jgi:hypothetical protein